MKNTNLLILIGAVIVLAAIATLSIKGCRDKKVVVIEPTYTQKQIDSVAALNTASVKVIDEIMALYNQTSIVKDSLKSSNDKKSKELEVQTLRVKVLTREAQLARNGGEIEDFILACDSLLPQIDSLMNIADVYRIENALLHNAFDSLLSNNSLHIARLEFEKEFIQEKFDKVAAHALELETNNKNLDKKAGKRIGIGPSAGATYYQEKIRPYVGIGIHYSIIRL